MKVYALWTGEYSDTRLWGIFSSHESAQQWIDQAKKLGINGYGMLGADPDNGGGRIEEFKMNKLVAYKFELDALLKDVGEEDDVEYVELKKK